MWERSVALFSFHNTTIGDFSVLYKEKVFFLQKDKKSHVLFIWTLLTSIIKSNLD